VEMGKGSPAAWSSHRWTEKELQCYSHGEDGPRHNKSATNELGQAVALGSISMVFSSTRASGPWRPTTLATDGSSSTLDYAQLILI
jgi:hypothetical protein